MTWPRADDGSTIAPAAAMPDPINRRRSIISCPPPLPSGLHASIDRKDAAGDMADPAMCLDGIVFAVEVIDRADGVIVDQPGVGIAQIPAAAIVADDDLGP